MTLGDFAHGILALVLGVCSTSLLAEDRSASPDTITPAHPLDTAGPPYSYSETVAPFKLAVVTKLDRAASCISFQHTIFRSTIVAEKVRFSNGQYVERTRERRSVPETVFETAPLGNFSFYDAKGNRLIIDAFVGRVNPGDTVLICEGGRLPDRKYLRIFRDDTMILVRGDPSMPPSLDASPPSTYRPNGR